MAEDNPSEESPGGHELWPVGADEILLAHGDGPRNTVTIYFETVNGIVTTTLNADTLFTEDMFRSQDPDLCAPGPNEPQEDLPETPDLVCAEAEGAGPSSRISATGPNYPQEDSDATPDIDFHASMDLASEEDNGPEPSNRMSDHPTPPELQSVSGARKKHLCTPTKTTDSDSTSDDEDKVPISPSDYPGVRASRLSEYRKKLTPAEIKSQDFIYEDMSPTVSGVRKKQFVTTATTTDSDSDLDYSERPFSSISPKSSNGNKDFTCLLCKRRFCKMQAFMAHVYWHADSEPREESQSVALEEGGESQSGTSEDVPIVSSGAENDSDYELFRISDWNKVGVVGNGPLKQLNLKDFNVVYGEDFMERNQEYVTDFLNELHQRQTDLEEGAHDPQIVEDISDEPQISEVEDNNDKTIE